MIPELPLSVIVCTYNRAHYLSACLESLARQECRVPFEVLVVDNGSADDTPHLLESWCREHPQFRSIRESRQGLSAAKNAGVRAARGQLLLFTDDDVVVERSWVRSYYEFFLRRTEGLFIAGGPIVPVPHDLGSWPAWFDPCALPDVGLLDYREERPLGRYEYVWGANMAIPAALFLRAGVWDENVGRKGEERGTFEDTEYQDRVLALGGTVWFCPSASLEHRIPRQDIEPSRLLRNAFARGRNQFWRQLPRDKDGELALTPRTDYLRCLVGLGRHLGKLALWSVAFASGRRRWAFCRAHAAAESSGAAVDVLRAGRDSSRVTNLTSRVSWRVLDLAARLTRTVETGRG